MPQDLPSGWAPSGRPNVPTVPPERAPREYGPPERYRVRALVALGVAVLGIGAFIAGVREAVRRIPPDAEARAAARGDSARRTREADMARRRAGAGRSAGGEDVPRLR